MIISYSSRTLVRTVDLVLCPQVNNNNKKSIKVTRNKREENTFQDEKTKGVSDLIERFHVEILVLGSEKLVNRVIFNPD